MFRQDENMLYLLWKLYRFTNFIASNTKPMSRRIWDRQGDSRTKTPLQRTELDLVHCRAAACLHQLQNKSRATSGAKSTQVQRRTFLCDWWHQKYTSTAAPKLEEYRKNRVLRSHFDKVHLAFATLHMKCTGRSLPKKLAKKHNLSGAVSRFITALCHCVTLWL